MELDADVAAAMAARGTALVSTLAIFRSWRGFATTTTIERFTRPRAPGHGSWTRQARAEESVRLARAAGVAIATGTDFGGGSTRANQLAWEVECLVAAGLEPWEALGAATWRGGELLGEPEAGRHPRGRAGGLQPRPRRSAVRPDRALAGLARRLGRLGRLGRMRRRRDQTADRRMRPRRALATLGLTVMLAACQATPAPVSPAAPTRIAASASRPHQRVRPRGHRTPSASAPNPSGSSARDRRSSGPSSGRPRAFGDARCGAVVGAIRPAIARAVGKAVRDAGTFRPGDRCPVGPIDAHGHSVGPTDAHGHSVGPTDAHANRLAHGHRLVGDLPRGRRLDGEPGGVRVTASTMPYLYGLSQTYGRADAVLRGHPPVAAELPRLLVGLDARRHRRRDPRPHGPEPVQPAGRRRPVVADLRPGLPGRGLQHGPRLRRRRGRPWRRGDLRPQAQPRDELHLRVRERPVRQHPAARAASIRA